ncbi:PAS domain-containing protein [Carboxylicivirga sediminis]|uniref:PAS domain-containing protein n=1 Tax=Carboxylicivirga sediminis TaxID=2006564 RepID=A0A941F174_9BACT|nr:PAS domain-containing protein [Carboxylicivirga sediminis]MBR8533935.1 PAS domain-containing protein [Carboxylicivirga sediminis]
MSTVKNGYEWAKELPYAVTVCDTEGIIIYMNDNATNTFAKYGDNLIGRSLYEFHAERSSAMIRQMLAEGSSNSYTIGKAGVKKLIHQSPWYHNGEVAGLVELSIVIPQDMPHINREA